MVLWHLHIQSRTTVSKILTRQHGALLANQQRSAVRVAANIVGTDGQVSDLETLDAVDVEALIQDAVLDDGVAFARSHGTCSEGMPCCLDVA
jgi:hypothetical protein